MTARYIGAIDQGTTGPAACSLTAGDAIGRAASTRATARSPEPGWVEDDADEILHPRHARADVAPPGPAPARDVAAVGIANQRETTCSGIGPPGARARMRWCGRTRSAPTAPRRRDADRSARAPACRARAHSRPRSSLPAAQPAGACARAEAGELASGTIDTWPPSQLAGPTPPTPPTPAALN